MHVQMGIRNTDLTVCIIQLNRSLFALIEVQYRYLYVSHVYCSVVVDVCSNARWARFC